MLQIRQTVLGMCQRTHGAVIAGTDLLAAYARGTRRIPDSKGLAFEPLEPRIALSGAGLTDFVAQPSGALDGKIVFTSGGHGWQWSNALNRWATDRGDNNEIVEDFGNQDQMTFFADYLLRAGATVVPMRPVGHQLNEVVLDNDSAGVTYSGSWSISGSSVYYDEDYGAVADTEPYQFAAVSATETATATYTPNIPEAGFYPVYTWVLDSPNRTNQLYRINDSAGGVTEIRVDHRMVGKGWVYLGTYHFDAGSSGNVQISNQSAEGDNVIADAIRFGNGMGDMLDGPSGVGHPSGTISGEPREDEDSMMWTWRAIGQGNSAASVIGTSNVSAPTRMAEHMNANTNPFGTSVYIGFHSNAGGGRGAVGLIDQTFSDQTLNQPELALFTGRQINQDMQALNGLFEHNWSTRTTHTFSGNFGEIDLGQSAEMDATIIETAFHDSAEDAELMRDPKVREQLARSTYEAALEYFDNFGGLSSPASQPSAPVDVTATTDLNGDVTVSWSPGPTGVQGGAPTAYRVYVSRDGYGFSGYVEVAGAGAGSHTFCADDLDNDAYYFKVVAVNSGGESPRSTVVSARDSGVGSDRILIVDGFDRNGRSQNERLPYAFTGDGLVDRVRTRYNNSFDYVVQVGEALGPANANFDAAQNESIISGDVNLDDYEAVIWILGEESSADDTFNATEQTKVTTYLAGGGKLFVSGAEIAWDLDNLNNGRTFYNNQLHADYVLDDANTYNVSGAVGSIFAGLSFSFDDGSQFYDSEFPDVINPLGGATTALNYVGGTGGGAAIQFDSGGSTKVVNLGFPFETITTAADRIDVMDRVLEFFGLDPDPTADFNEDTKVNGFDFLAWQLGLGTTSGASLSDGDADFDGDVDDADLTVWNDQFGTTTLAASGTAVEAVVQSSTAGEALAPSATSSQTTLLGQSDSLVLLQLSSPNFQRELPEPLQTAATIEEELDWALNASLAPVFGTDELAYESSFRTAEEQKETEIAASDEAFAVFSNDPLGIRLPPW